MADLQEKYALVTGGSSGIGLAMAKELAARGFSLLLVSNQALELARCAQTIKQQYGVECLTLEADLSLQEAAQQVYTYCRERGLMIDILVNNAGMLIFSEVTDVPEQKVQAILNLHMHTPVMLCRLFGEDMRQLGKGYVLNVSSISAVMPYPGISLYGPTKTFLRQFTRAFRYEMEPHGVKVCAVLPGATETGLYDPAKVNLKLAKRLGVMQTAEYVAGSSVTALFQGKAECVPGWMNKLTVWVLPLVPRFVIRIIYRKTEWISRGKNALG